MESSSWHSPVGSNIVGSKYYLLLILYILSVCWLIMLAKKLCKVPHRVYTVTRKKFQEFSSTFQDPKLFVVTFKFNHFTACDERNSSRSTQRSSYYHVNWHTLRTHHYTIDAYRIVATACLRTVHYRGPAAKWLKTSSSY